ncbi:ferredoxin reductase-like protein [Hesseltinella vesiculosa]|uniref:NADH-cytochrome b5 reductase n=1 Tax=Hesseltinella vesiculosa TaxID=101127 RepID=A0A1X2G3V4_9FUNG|nr:ferredoxin reductase-like protein [Hesseltinella vesiculosa]
MVRSYTSQQQKQNGHARSQRWAKPAGILATTAIGFIGWHQWDAEQRKERLDSDWYIPMELLAKKQLSPDTVQLRIRTKKIAGQSYPVPSCLFIKDDAIQVMRPYTPLNPNPYQDGYIDLLVKRYPNGSVSRTLSGHPLQEPIFIRGPMVEEYQYQPDTLDEVGMIAGGTGISPMYQLIRHILDNDNDTTKIWLLYANKQEHDILLKTELDQLAEKHAGRFKVVYVLEQTPADWPGQQGRVTLPMISSMLQSYDAPEEKPRQRRVFVCGPDAMVQAVCGQKPRPDAQGPVAGMLASLGLSSQEVWKLQ